MLFTDLRHCRRYRDDIDNNIDDKSSIFSLIYMCQLQGQTGS